MGLSLGRLKFIMAGFWFSLSRLDLGLPICKNPLTHSPNLN